MQPHFHVTATADDGTRAEHIEGEGAYLPALAVAVTWKCGCMVGPPGLPGAFGG